MALQSNAARLFRQCGFYIHAGFVYEHPFAVRRWTRQDYTSMFTLLRSMHVDRVMLWPMMELAPSPLSESDAAYLADVRLVVEDAHKRGLECWLTCSPNLSSRETIRGVPDIRNRVWHPHERIFQFDRREELDAFVRHMGTLLEHLNNADAYVFIDGDPGGYSGARPPEFLAMLQGIRRELRRIAPGRAAGIIHWVWCGWGADWEKDGIWKSDLAALVRNLLSAMKKDTPVEPWGLLPGRHLIEARGNGRAVMELVDEAGLMDRSTLMLYEIVEIEPSPPAVVIQFDDIRRVLRQECRYASVARGVMANAQTPLTSLHNLFYFARCVNDPSWLDKSDDEVLVEFARFLGGDPQALIPAWTALRRNAGQFPADAADRLRRSRLSADVADHIPAGPETYIRILADFLQTHITVVNNTARPPATAAQAADQLTQATLALVRWWTRHKYVLRGESGFDFDWSFTHRALSRPLREWVRASLPLLSDRSLQHDIVDALMQNGKLPRSSAEKAVADLCESSR